MNEFDTINMLNDRSMNPPREAPVCVKCGRPEEEHAPDDLECSRFEPPKKYYPSDFD